MRRDGRHHELDAAKRIGEVAGDSKPLRKADIRQVDRIGAALCHIDDQPGVAGPQARLVARTRQVDGERGSPTAGTEYRNLTNSNLL